jgi:ATPase components of various ABC-type transport systems, contain duplicated ATPase
MSTILEVIDLETQFKTDDKFVKAVDKISFTLNRGETLGIVGESGSGKSVSVFSIMRLIPDPPGKITGGKIFYDSKDSGRVDLLSITEKQMLHYRGNEISMIFQEPMTSLNPVFRCGEQVVEAIELHQKVSHQEAKERTLNLFNEVKLPNPERIFQAYPHQLSGGQKQRVMIAMAMSCNPHILIADEPTTALDVTVQATILDLMRQLRDEIGMSIIFITHDLGVIGEIADKVAVMYKGKIVEQGTTLDIFSNPQHPYTKSLLACRPPLGIRLKKLPVISDFMNEDENGNMVEVNASVEQVVNSVIVSEKETQDRRNALMNNAPRLRVKNLKTYFPSTKNFFGKVLDWVRAVDDVSFDVYPGETLGLVGESGCGKTTLGKNHITLS